MREFIFQKRKILSIRFRIYLSRFKRSLRNHKLTHDDFYNIPVIINNRNRLTFLKQLIESMEKLGYKHIIILDNDSTYPPLLEYYRSVPYKIHYLGKNLGYKALWLSPVFEEYKKSWYVYTDPDMIPADESAKDVLERLYHVLQRFPKFEKAGVALKIDDLPDQYSRKKEVLAFEQKWWEKKIDDNVYEAAVDTTFALYRPYAKGAAEECPACRLAGKYIFRHLPWYENSEQPSDEELYYRASVTRESSYWLSSK